MPQQAIIHIVTCGQIIVINSNHEVDNNSKDLDNNPKDYGICESEVSHLGTEERKYCEDETSETRKVGENDDKPVALETEGKSAFN